MADRVDPDVRSATMANIRSELTGLENKFVSFLDVELFEVLERNSPDVFGKPDLLFRDAGVAVFIDSCFWHGCAKHCRLPKTNEPYWHTKIRKNRVRDRVVTKRLKNDGWVVLRIWEHSIIDGRSRKWWTTRLKNTVVSRSN